MDSFDKYLFDELTELYAKPDLSWDDLEELYLRFCNLDHLSEVRPYLWTMRFFGWGTASEEDAVLAELKANCGDGEALLTGLYYDLSLCRDGTDAEALANLKRMTAQGYNNVYTKDRSSVAKIQRAAKAPSAPPTAAPRMKEEKVVVDHITFECNDYYGLNFTAGDTDYLSAKVYIKPIRGKKHIKVRSQIFLNDEPFSEVMSNEYEINEKTRWFQTSGWGNEKCTCYGGNTYRWAVEIDGNDVYTQDFHMLYGQLNKGGVMLKEMKMFASKASGALEKDRYNYKTIFDRNTLEYVYFKFMFIPTGEYRNVQLFIKVIRLEDQSVFYDGYSIIRVQDDWDQMWTGIGFSKPGQWKSGLYQYTVSVGNGPVTEGVFTVS